MTDPRDSTSKIVRAAHLLVLELRDADHPYSRDEVNEAILRGGLYIGDRELRRVCKYARDHGAPVVCTRRPNGMTLYWLERYTKNTELAPNRYLLDAYRSLVAWYRSTARGGGLGHRTLRNAVGLAIDAIGHYQGLDREQITAEMRPLYDPVLEEILG